MFMYLVAAPFFMVADFHWVTPLLSFLLSLVLLGIDEIAVEIEDPFGNDANDIDLIKMLRKMDADICTILFNVHGGTPAQRSRQRTHSMLPAALPRKRNASVFNPAYAGDEAATAIEMTSQLQAAPDSAAPARSRPGSA